MKFKFFIEQNEKNKSNNMIMCHINSRTIKDNMVETTINDVRAFYLIEDIITMVVMYKTHYIDNPKVLESWEKWNKAQWIKVNIDWLNSLIVDHYRLWHKDEARKADYEEWYLWYGNSKKPVKYVEHIPQIAVDRIQKESIFGFCMDIGELIGLKYMLKNIKWADDEDNVLLGIIDG